MSDAAHVTSSLCVMPSHPCHECTPTEETDHHQLRRVSPLPVRSRHRHHHCSTITDAAQHCNCLVTTSIRHHWTREVFRDETGYICLSTWAFWQLKISFYQAFTWKNGQMTLNGLAAFHPSLVMDSGYSCWMMWQKVSGQPHPSSLHHYCIEIQWIPLVINAGDYFGSPLTSLSQTPPLSYFWVFNLSSQWTSSSTHYVSIERRKVCHLLRFSFTKLHHIIITTYHITIYFYVWT